MQSELDSIGKLWTENMHRYASHTRYGVGVALPLPAGVQMHEQAVTTTSPGSYYMHTG